MNALKEPACRLKYSTSNIIGIGLTGKPPAELTKKCWMYFPESNCPFYRVTVFSNYCPNNVPDINTQWSLMAEVSESPHKPVDAENLIEDTIEGMFATKLINKSHDVLSTLELPRPLRLSDAGAGTRRGPQRDAAGTGEAGYLFSRGRFGGWKYEVSNQDHSLMQGVELVDKLKLGRPGSDLLVPRHRQQHGLRQKSLSGLRAGEGTKSPFPA